MDQSEQNFIAYEVGASEHVIVKAYIYEDGKVSEQTLDVDKRSGIINAGFTTEGNKLTFKLDGITRRYDEQYNGFMSDRTEKDIVLTTQPKLVATYYASFKEGATLSTERSGLQGEPYQKLNLAALNDDELIIDIVAYINKK